MAIIKSINGEALPPEASIQHDVMTIDKGSGNNLSGNMKRNILGEKDKFTITYPPMPQKEVDALLAFFRRSSLSVRHQNYWNSKEIVTQPMYHGDMSKSVYSYAVHGVLYEELTVELISYNVRKINY